MEGSKQRLLSLDVLRGLTVAGMILVNNGYGESFEMLRHSSWNGMTPCDLVFPFFLFIVGVSCYLALSKSQFNPTWPVVRKIFKRTFLLFFIGLAIHWVEMALDGRPLDFAHLRIWAVLQRIALCYFLVSLFALFVSHRYVIHVVLLLLAAYTLILLFGNGYSEDASVNVIAQADLRLFGYDHIYHKSPVDPEGLLGTIPSVAHTLRGFYCGQLITKGSSVGEKALRIFVLGTVLIVCGYLLTYGLPLNKRIWSPSYVLVTCGLASLLLGLLVYVIDIQGRQTWALPFRVFGTNALALYVGSELLAILFGHFDVSTFIYDALHALILPSKWASLAYALTFVLINYAIGYLLYRRHIFIKL